MKFPKHILLFSFSVFLFAVLGSPLSAQVLKQSTAVTVQIGPAVAASDGNTEVADLTITEIEISKAGGTFAAANGSATLTLDDDGFYKLALTTSDTDTLGLLVVKVVDATAMTWGERYQVIAANAYDGIYGSSDYLQVDAVQVEGSDATDALDTAADTVTVTSIGANVITATAIATDAITAAKIATDAIGAAEIAANAIGASEIATGAIVKGTEITGFNDLDAAGVRGAVGLASANLDTQLDALPTTAEVNTEVDTALADYDGPTQTELTSAFTEIKGATWSSSTDTLEAIRDRGDAAWITGAGGGDGSTLTAIPWNSAWDAEVQSEAADAIAAAEPIDANVTQIGGSAVSAADGSDFSAIPWNAAWDAEVQSEVADALSVYDPPTAAEVTSAFTEIKGATWSSATDTLEQIRDNAGSGGDGSSFTAIPWNAAWDAEVQSEAADALAAYDPPTRAELTTDTNSVLAILGTPTDTDLATDLANVEAGSGLDAAGVRAAVGLAAANLDTQLSSIGASTDTLYTYTFTSAPQGTQIFVYSDTARTTLVRFKTSDATGIVTFDLPAATYYYLAVNSSGAEATGSFTVAAP